MGLGFALGAAVPLLMPATGCVVKDVCILVIKPGLRWCAVVEDGMMWPEGQPDAAEPVLDEGGGALLVCDCFNDDESQVLADEIPADYYEILAGEVIWTARLKCDSLVPSGFDHNCFEEGPDDPVAHTLVTNGKGSCVGDCVYVDCGDPTPHECEAIVEGDWDGGGNDEAGETGETGGTGGTGTGDTGSGDTGGVWSPSLHVNCTGNECEIDRAFAASIWEDPMVLLTEQTRLAYDSVAGRFVFQGAEPRTLAAELGLRDGDVLESVNGRTIDDLDSAMEVYADSGDASVLRVRVQRGAEWVDFTYNFVD